jgi:CRP/FNR family transcriptional regulator/CRP/FNR family nitrogen fixation transcriptional regulator
LLANCPDVVGLELRLARGECIFDEGQEALFYYRVVAGAVRTQRVLGDGRRLLEAFHLPDEVFGLELSSTRRLAAEAVVDTTVLAFERSTVEAMAARNIGVAQELRHLAADRLKRSIEQAFMLARMTATEKVTAFLVDMEARIRPDGDIALPMSWRDIADYLGLTPETVSRAMYRVIVSVAIRK